MVAGALALAVALTGVLAFYRWTAQSTQRPTSFSASVSTDRYNQLVDAFEAGRLDLPLPVPPGLAALPDPADPVANAPYRASGFQDLSVHEGRLYLYWGPVPALTLFWPSRALGIGRFPQVYAVALFAALAFLCASGLLLSLTKRLAPATPWWMRVVGVVALGGTAVWPWLIRRPEVYEVAIAAATAFLFAGLWLLAVGIVARRARPVPVALGSLCLGLAAGSRASFAAAGLLPLAWVAWRARLTKSNRVRALDALSALGPLAACGAALLAYNAARFGSPLDFGVSRLLLSPDNAGLGSRPVNVGPGVWFYLFAPLHFVGQFPYMVVDRPLSAPFDLPATWLVRERTGGLLATTPVALLALGALTLRRRRTTEALVIVIVSAVTLGLLLLVFDSFYVNGVIQRYEADFAGLLVLAGLLGWFGLWGAAGGLVRLYMGVAGAALALFGAIAGALLSLSGPDATLPYDWESLAPRLDFLTPFGASFGWTTFGRQLWLGTAVLAGAAGVVAVAGALIRRLALHELPAARRLGRAAAAAGAAVVMAAVLADHGAQAPPGLGTGRALLLLSGIAVALTGAVLTTLASEARATGEA